MQYSGKMCGGKVSSCGIYCYNPEFKLALKYSCYTDFAMLPYNFSIKNISFKSSNKSVATVNKNSGLITPKKKGKCEITVTVKDRAGTKKTCKIKMVVK